MIEAISIMLCLSIVLSVWAYFVWMNISRARQLRRLDGRAVPEIGDVAVATQLLVLIVIVDMVAAAFAFV